MAGGDDWLRYELGGMEDTRPEDRSPIRAAFEGLVAVCQAHREVWCTDELSNRAMSRLFNSVELLGKLEPVQEEPRRKGGTSASDGGLWRVVQRLDWLYDQVERTDMGLAGKRALPARVDLPLEREQLLVYAERVVRVLEQYALDFALMGVDPDRAVGLAHAIHQARLRTKHVERAALMQPADLVGMYQRQLNACLRMLLERVDPVMPRYREHVAFQQAYQQAREAVAALCIGGRLTYHVDGIGQVSGLHRDAYTPWPALDATDPELPTSDELHRALGNREDQGNEGRDGEGR